MSDQMRIDLHCHTSASYDGTVDPVRLVALARDRGLTHVAITDHETIDGALTAKAAAVPGVTVIVGEEVRTAEGDLILLFVATPIAGGLPVEETVRLAREQGCVIGLPHPFDAHRPSIAVGAGRSPELERLAGFADYVEVHNGRVREDLVNARAADFSRQFGLAQVAASDCHTEDEVAICYTEVSDDVGSAGALRHALEQANLRVVHQPVEATERFLDRLRRVAGRTG